MSLLVNVYVRDKTGKMVWLDPPDPSKELAGFEVFRKTFYGSNAARSLGLRLLPLLAEGDLYAKANDLITLRDEATLILQNISSFAGEAEVTREVLQFRIENILDAIERAQKVSGGVVIW